MHISSVPLMVTPSLYKSPQMPIDLHPILQLLWPTFLPISPLFSQSPCSSFSSSDTSGASYLRASMCLMFLLEKFTWNLYIAALYLCLNVVPVRLPSPTLWKLKPSPSLLIPLGHFRSTSHHFTMPYNKLFLSLLFTCCLLMLDCRFMMAIFLKNSDIPTWLGQCSAHTGVQWMLVEGINERVDFCKSFPNSFPYYALLKIISFCQQNCLKLVSLLVTTSYLPNAISSLLNPHSRAFDAIELFLPLWNNPNLSLIRLLFSHSLPF